MCKHPDESPAMIRSQSNGVHVTRVTASDGIPVEV